MRCLLLACICLLFCISSWAKVIIQLYDDDHETREIDKRAVSIRPVASHDGGTISIYFPIPINSFQVMVKDAAGDIVYINVVTEPSKCHLFEISSLITDGEYLLEIEIGDQNYRGNFSI